MGCYLNELLEELHPASLCQRGLLGYSNSSRNSIRVELHEAQQYRFCRGRQAPCAARFKLRACSCR